MGGVLGGAHAGELARAGHERLEYAAGLNSPKVSLVVDRPDHCVADARAVACDVAGHDRRRLLERRILNQRQQPALGQLVAAHQERFDSFSHDRPWSAATWHTPLHPASFTTH